MEAIWVIYGRYMDIRRSKIFVQIGDIWTVRRHSTNIETVFLASISPKKLLKTIIFSKMTAVFSKLKTIFSIIFLKRRFEYTIV